MNHYEKFAMSGIGKDLLNKVLESNKDFIEYFNDINCFFIDERGILVLCQADKETMEEEGYTPYPFSVTTGMIAEHIINACKEVSKENLGKLNQLPSGYEEDYEYGWMIFKPTGSFYEKSESNNEYNISNYDWFNVVLAAYPVLIEYGK